MKVYKSPDEFPKPGNAVVTIGTFDGVHTGHQKIIERLKQLAGEISGETLILTFFPHPRLVLYPDDRELKMINTLDEQIALLEKQGIDHLIISPFTKDLARLSAEDFVKDILVNKIGVRKLVIGYNHQFGRNREGNFDLLMKLGLRYHFSVEKIPEHDVRNISVSSTRIREALKTGDIRMANDLLGHPFTLSGIVIKGQTLGKELEMPTANLWIRETYKLIPLEGIYAVKITYKGDALKGVLYIGNRPTLNQHTTTHHIEVNIFNFAQDLYDEHLTVSFMHRIRNDRKFNSLQELKAQMQRDKQEAIRLLNDE